jgi:nitrous oxide reductase accessory protein NosL
MKCVIAVIDEWTDTHGPMYWLGGDDSCTMALHKAKTFQTKEEATEYIAKVLPYFPLPLKVVPA